MDSLLDAGRTHRFFQIVFICPLSYRCIGRDASGGNGGVAWKFCECVRRKNLTLQGIKCFGSQSAEEYGNNFRALADKLSADCGKI